MTQVQPQQQQLDPVLGHNAITAIHAYYTDLVNYFLREARQQKLALQAQLAQEKDAHEKTKAELTAAQKKLLEPYPTEPKAG